MLDLIILLPFFNEEKQISLSCKRLFAILDPLNISYQLCLIDDGSQDSTWDHIQTLTLQHPQKLRGLRLSRNFGKEAAICAGLDQANAKAVILMDGDLQHPPEHIPQMIQLWQEGPFKIIEGVKSSRGNESFLSKINATLFYKIFRKISKLDLENASDYKLLDRQVVLQWREFKEHKTFFRGLSAWVGFPRTSFNFEVAPRETGETRWSFKSLMNLSFNAITSFSSTPLHLITAFGIVFLIGAIILTIQTLIRFFSGHAANGFTTVILIQLAVGASLLLSLGLISVYIARIFDEVKDRPRYIISEDTDAENLSESIGGEM